jgi:hypothetical protein
MAVYRANHVGFARLIQAPAIRRHVRSRAEAFANELRQWATTHARSGEYARSVRVELGRDILKGNRPAAFVVANTDYATALEVGSHNIRNPPRPITEILERFGE